MRIISVFTIFIIILYGFSGCKRDEKKEIIIFHAGSLSVPFKELSKKFEEKNPGIKVLLEAAGSLVCARKVTELKKPCDIVASADYFVIDKLLIPDYATWGIRFATNEIVIAYNDKARYSRDITSSNWKEILQRPDVIYCRSDPDSDPCGYRTVLTFKLSEKYYNYPGLTDKLVSKDKDYIRPKEVDLVALVEAGAADYMFQYKSVAIQHRMKYVELPDEINLSDPLFNAYYKTVSFNVKGSTPESTIVVVGDYINYSLTIIENAPHREEAIKFIDFLLSPEGTEIFRKNGQDPIIPFSTDVPEKIPAVLLKHLKDNPAKK